ncbi:MAG: DUF86 domain-containing protein [Candidatus Aenigmarchaeota archaeon]|nr:DUF86 domain-containing protein [Candidatus Aenigmarchaeota archaeon]MCK5322365.1 DUF86 domain-containing protein [Candidatus Aenigmarchaeota archaeon]
MKKDDSVFISHILDSIQKIEEFTENVSKEDFFDSVLLQDAIMRRIEIIGEASKNVSDSLKSKYPEIPWTEMARTRDKLIHGYFGIDLDLTWDIVEEDISELKDKIKVIVDNL